jgi:release factor glutamine methyltransferase
MATIGEWRLRLRQELQPVAGEFAATDADAIIGEVLSARPTELTLRYREQVEAVDEAHLTALLVKRLSGSPLAYVLGHVEFYGLDFLCDERVLIPRPETEELVNVALRALPPPVSGTQPLVLEVGTGAGNIVVALARQRPDLRLIATDLSGDALAVARENARRHGEDCRITFIQARTLDGFGPVPRFDLIVSNPPYIPLDDPNVQRSVHDYEPHIALYAGRDGTEILSALIDHGRAILKPGGALVCEIGFMQEQPLAQIIARFAGWDAPIFHRSIAGFDRVLELRRLITGLS